MTLSELFTNIANAIRSKYGTTELINATDLPQRILDIPSGEDNSNKILDGSIEEIINDDITSIKTYAFHSCKDLKKAVFNNVITCNTNAFTGCSSLQSISMPNLKKIGYFVFNGCPLLNDINLPNLEGVINDTNNGSNSNQPFAGVGNKTNIPFKIVLKNFKSIGYSQRNTFNSCGASVISIPRFNNNNQFYVSIAQKCKNLQIFDFGVVSSIASYNFSDCSKLTTLIIRKSTLCSLENINAFNGTPFASGGTGGEVYVPASLIEGYQNATNWSTLYNSGTLKLKAIEDSIYKDLDWANEFDVSTLGVD